MRCAAIIVLLPAFACHRAPPPELPVRAQVDAEVVEHRIAPTAGSLAHLPLAITRSFAGLRDGAWIDDTLFTASPVGVVAFDDLDKTPIVIGPAEGLVSPAVVRVTGVRGELWAATDRGVSRVDPKTRRVVGALLEGEAVRAITDDGLLVTARGLVRADGNVRWPHPDALDAIHCGARWIVVTREGTYAIRGARAERIAGLPAVPASRLSCEGNDVLAATALGLYEIGDRARLRQRGPISNATFLAGDGDRRATFVDRTLWISRDGAVPTGRGFPGPRGLVTAIVPDGDDVWIGTFDDGLHRLGTEGYTTRALPDARVTALLPIAGAMLAGTATGLYRLDASGLRPLAASDPWLGRYVSTLRRVGDRVVAGVFPGLVELDARTLSTKRRISGKPDEPGSAGAPALFGTTVNGATTRDGALWLATLEGVQRLDAHGTQVTSAISGALPDDWVNDVMASDKDVWFLLGDRGIGRVEHDGRVRTWLATLHTQSGSLTRLGEQIVFLADGALYVARPRAGREIDLVRFGAAEGLPILATALALDARGRLWLAGEGGVVRFDDAARRLDEATRPLDPDSKLLAEVL